MGDLLVYVQSGAAVLESTFGPLPVAPGTVSWAAKDPLPLIEFTVGGIKLSEVRGPDVAAWNQANGRVQVWLRPGVREGAVEWTGTRSPGAFPFDLAHPVVAHARSAADDVRAKPADGFTLKADRATGWQALPGPAGELRFRTDIPAPLPPRVQLLPAMSANR